MEDVDELDVDVELDVDELDVDVELDVVELDVDELDVDVELDVDELDEELPIEQALGSLQTLLAQQPLSQSASVRQVPPTVPWLSYTSTSLRQEAWYCVR